MDRWIKVDVRVNGPKLRALAKEIGCSEAEALGILVNLWIWGADGNADGNGLLGNTDRSDIAKAIVGKISTRINADEVADAMIRTAWIDETEEGLFLHDWPEHQEYYINFRRKRERDALRKRQERSRKAGHGERSSEKPSDQLLPPDPPKLPAVSATSEQKYSSSFECFWAAYPKKVGKGEAYRKYQTRRKDGYSEDELLEATKRYADQCRKLHTEPEYIKHPKTFLSDSLPFLDFLPGRGEGELSPESPAVKTENTNPFAEFE